MWLPRCRRWGMHGRPIPLPPAHRTDEPVTAYDELDDDAKDLIDAIRERQAYIATGMLDPEGFDDFRVVIGENGLRG